MVCVKVTIDVDPSFHHGWILSNSVIALTAKHYRAPNANEETSETRLSIGVLQLRCAQRSARDVSIMGRSRQVQFIGFPLL